jgi:hypothetical protein
VGMSRSMAGAGRGRPGVEARDGEGDPIAPRQTGKRRMDDSKFAGCSSVIGSRSLRRFTVGLAQLRNHGFVVLFAVGGVVIFHGLFIVTRPWSL